MLESVLPNIQVFLLPKAAHHTPGHPPPLSLKGRTPCLLVKGLDILKNASDWESVLLCCLYRAI